ncbi:MAG: preprotein translocase subunit YajC [Alphaproteobacteria bacterium]|nr:preprotein translocase subunit YajC [Alphaproteobacteria bacterium]
MSLDTLTNNPASNNTANQALTTISKESEKSNDYFGLDPAFASMMPLVIILVIFYFFLVRPQEQKRKEMENLVQSVKKGEDVITTSGIFGKVSKVSEKEPYVFLEISENNNIKILKSAIAEITSRVAFKDTKK